MITTTGDLATFVLRASGITGLGQTPTAEDSYTCLDFMRMLTAQWQRKRWLVWNEEELSKVATGNGSGVQWQRTNRQVHRNRLAGRQCGVGKSDNRASELRVDNRLYFALIAQRRV